MARVTREWMFNLPLAATACVLAALGGEIVTRQIAPRPLPWFTPQSLYAPSPAMGFRYRPNQTAYTADKAFRTNSMGLRGPERSWSKPPGSRRVLILGDSIAEGFGVREEDTFAARLERMLNERNPAARHEVINAGVGAYNTAQEVAYLASEGIRLDPDLVVLALYWNDVSDKKSVRVSDEGFLIEAGEPRERSAAQRFWSSGPIYAVRNVLKRSRLLYFVSDRWRQLHASYEPDSTRTKQLAVLLGISDPAVHAGWRDVEANLAMLRAACGERHIPLLIMVLPMPQQLDAQYPNIRYQSVVQEMCTRQGLTCLDLLASFQQAYRGHTSLFIPYDGDHPNEQGHELIANGLLPAVDGVLNRNASSAVGPDSYGATRRFVGGASAAPEISSAPISHRPLRRSPS